MGPVILIVTAAILPWVVGAGESAAIRHKSFPCWSVPVKPYLITRPCYTAGRDVLCRCSNITLDCSSNFGQLTYVPRVFSGVQVLNFSNNELRQLSSDHFFVNVSRSVWLLDLYNNDMASMAPNAFRHLHSLTTVLIGGNKLSYNDLRTVFDLPTLKNVDIKCGKLGVIPSDYFSKTPSVSLESLDMSWNNFDALDMRALQPLRKLRVFTLWHNDLSMLHTAYLPSLKTLSLRGNRLYDFPITCKEGSANESLFPNLTKLILNFNPISTIHDPVCLPLLAVLEMQYNQIVYFPANMFSLSKFPVLKELSLNQMERKIKAVSAYTFNNSALEFLGLGYNSLDFSDGIVSENTLAGCSGITQLYMDQNNFNKVSKEWLHCFLSHVQNLETLYMGEAQISSISADTFTNLPRLTHLYLYTNSLFSVPSGAFDHLPRLQHLYLGNNHLPTINSDTFSESTQQRLVSLDISGNPFHCGCESLWFQQWMRERPDLFEDFQGEGYRCANLDNQKVQDFRISEQACILDRSTSLLLISFISFIIFLFVLFIAVFGYRWHIRLWLYAVCRGRHERSRRQAEREARGFRYDVFLAYAEEDVEWVQEQLLPVLEERWRLRVCLHQRDFLPGKHIMDNISDSVEESDRLLMVFSPHFARSPWCQFELKLCQSLAMERDDVMIMLMLQGTRCQDLSGAMLAVLQTTTYLQWTADPHALTSFWGRVALALGDVLPS